MPFFDINAADLPNYRSKVTAPADFDAFWAGTLAEARQFPLDATFTPVDVGLTLVDVFDVSFRGFGGHQIKGWLIQPKGGAKSCVVKFIGYNGGRGFPHEHLLWPATGRAVLVMDTRGQGSGWAVGETADPVGSDPQQSGFMTKGIGDKASYFYRRVFTDGVRAVEAARSRGFDKVGVVGGSQGGGISIAVAGLVPDLDAAMPDVPYLCDFPRAIGLAQRDPYNEISRYLSVHRDKIEATFETLRYFDGVNFSARAKAPALFSVAVMDTICPPSTVYGAYNAYAAPKEIASYTFNDHEGGGPFQDRRQVEWLARHL
jgi:cephalosporin-C deacetylase